LASSAPIYFKCVYPKIVCDSLRPNVIADEILSSRSRSRRCFDNPFKRLLLHNQAWRAYNEFFWWIAISIVFSCSPTSKIYICFKQFDLIARHASAQCRRE
jgi:hypothetical protein